MVTFRQDLRIRGLRSTIQATVQKVKCWSTPKPLSILFFFFLFFGVTINQSVGLCNGKRMTLTQLGSKYIEAQIVIGTHVGDKVCIPRIIMTSNDTKWPFKLRRRQFYCLFVLQ
jgi:hypothetical protein